ncbi:FG-GAP-like repeat-containing protein [Myxococcus sp. Y35]|uniref:FG-GAP-like repeat-containing protein n=1 Tax=Pseudomyxococcus flavus TaxID=3115648 RepID=UPI003CF4CC97
MKLPSRALSLLLGALLFAGCINPVNEGERPCPCAEGWTCCPDANVCVADAARCEQLQPPKPPEPTAPSAPRLVSAIPDPGTVTLTWFEPAQDGGSAITGYEVGVEPHEDGIQVHVEGTTARVTGLRAGGTYGFTIAARNAVGLSPTMGVDGVSLPDVPTAPVALAVERGDRQVRVTWRAPASDGGRAVLHYVVTAHPSGVSTESNGPELTAIVGGLTNGVASTFTVHAVNAVGAGPASAESASVVPAASPGAPVSVAATPGVRTVSVSWLPPEDTGGLPVSGYVVTASPGDVTQQVDGAASDATFTDLQDDTEYTFTVAARNDVGPGTESGTASARTPARPSAPESVQAQPGVRSLTVTWEPPVSDGRAPVTGYTVMAQPSGVQLNVGAHLHSAVLENVPSTKAQTISVVARNAVGDSPAATAGAPVKTRPAPVEVTQLDVPTAVRGCQPVTYTLRQVDGERADVLVELDATGSGTFTRTTQAADAHYERASGLVALSTSLEGTAHTFRWNRPKDLPSAAPTALIRITATVPGTTPTTRTHAVALSAPEMRCEVDLDSSPLQSMPQSYSGKTYGTALGDFNQDGKPDIAVLHDANSEVRWLRGLGNGGLEFQNALPNMLMSGKHLVTADVDQDGALDLISADASSGPRVEVMRGQGQGFFDPRVYGFIPYQSSRDHTYDLTPPVVRDLDGDGTPEVVISLPTRLVVMRHTSGGQLTLAYEGPKVTHQAQGAVVAGDFNDDGRVDLVVIGGSIQPFYGQGSLTFTSESVGALEGNVPFATAADFNGDGHLDIAALVVGRNESTIYLLQGDGNGRFASPARLHHHTWHSFGDQSHLISGDFDGDGRQDLAYTHADANVVTLFQGRGDGTFEPRTLPSGRYPSRLVAGDFDASGKLDLAVLSGIQQTVRVLRDLEAPTPPAMGSVFVTADFDGDGQDDVASRVDGGAQVHLTRAEGGLVTRGPSPLPEGTWKLLAGRFDEGPTVDLFALTRQEEAPYAQSLVLMRGNGDGTFRSGEELPLGETFTTSSTRELVAGDVDGDGDLDVVIDLSREEGGRYITDLQLLRNAGDGTFSASGAFATYSSRNELLLKDLNQDGRADLVVLRGIYPTFELVMFEGRADGTLAWKLDYAPVVAACHPGGMVAEDLTGDGLVDLAVSCMNIAQGVLPMIGTGSFSFYDGRLARVGASSGRLTARDLDGDGAPELLVAAPEEQAVCVLPSWGHGDFGISSCFGTLATPHELALVDVDHDGVPEVLTGSGILSSSATLLRVR